MSEPKFTPGPWRVGRHTQLTVFSGTAGGHAVATAGVHSDNTRDPLRLYEEQKANACLIAAAPDLLRAVENAAYDFRELLEWIRVERAPLRDTEERSIAMRLSECRAALAKARGEA